MTREEALELIEINVYYDAFDNYSGYDSNVHEIFNKIFDYFEKRIAELEQPKSCGACKFFNDPRKCPMADPEAMSQNNYCYNFYPKDKQ